MSKRIYVGLQDPRKLAAVARKTGISQDLLKKAAAGQIELSPSDLKKVSEALRATARPRPD